MTDDDYEILVHMSNNAKPPVMAVKLLEDVCTRTNLEWKARHVYLMKRGDKWGVTLSIDGFRAVGARNVEYAGQEGPFWVKGADGEWTDIPPEGPIYASKVGIKKRNGITTWGVAKFKDYATGPMWSKFPSTMVAKCAEMLAWRKTFPEVFGGLYGAEEMEQSGMKPPKEEDIGRGSDLAKNDWVRALESAKDLAEVIKIGKEVNADKRLILQHNLELHQIYNRMKAKYEG